MTLAQTLDTEAAFFSDAVAVIAGGSSGVGLAAARRLAELGVTRILIVGRDARRGAAAAASVASATRCEPVFMSADALDPAQATAAIAAAVDRWGRVDILVNSLNGTHGPKLLHNMDIADVAPAVTNQMMGVLHMCKAAAGPMSDQASGVIVNIASDAAKSPTPGESAIGAAMAGIVMFTRTIAMELKRNGVRANVITPSIISGTGGFDRVMKDEFTSKLFGKAMTMAHLGVVEAEDMADLICFLCSPRSAKLTGQAISLNGGISAY